MNIVKRDTMETLKGNMENQQGVLTALVMATSTGAFPEVVTRPMVIVKNVLTIVQVNIVSGVLLVTMEMLLI